jgi:signal recognition particle subunit SRP54
MFENLSHKLLTAFDKLRGRGKLTEEDVAAAMREVRLALLEADVNFRVVKEFIARVRERCVGQEVLESLSPDQHVVKIVYEELAQLLGSNAAPINLDGNPAIVLLAGLQGGGKTTTAGKLASLLRKRGRKPLLVAADIYRPAAIKQLQVIGDSLNIPVYSMGDRQDPLDIARGAIASAKAHGQDVVIIDTAGRLHIDEEMMAEVQRVHDAVEPSETLLVVDAMTGQDAVTVADAFNQRLEVDGFVLTKLDGDARGGAALSLRAVTQKPIKLVGTGEKLDALEPFHPERMASRILGMGDVLSLIEKAEEAIDARKAAELEAKLRSNRFDFDDYLSQLQQVRKMGPLDQVLSMIPGLGGQRQLQGLELDERQVKRQEAIIQSMTAEERRDPDIINGSRKRRIARGSGSSVQDVNRLITQYQQMRAMVRMMVDAEKGKRRGPIRIPFLG